MVIQLLSGPTGPYKEGYLICNIKYPDGTVKIVGYHKYLWELNFGIIPKGFIVHHKNENKLDNRLENLELKSLSDHAKYHRKDREILHLTCIRCNKNFTRFANNELGNIRKGKRGPFCSRHCAGKTFN